MKYLLQLIRRIVGKDGDGYIRFTTEVPFPVQSGMWIRTNPGPIHDVGMLLESVIWDIPSQSFICHLGDDVSRESHYSQILQYWIDRGWTEEK